jgi:serine/threonine protein kinase/Flp pilus assembly protein TadD
MSNVPRIFVSATTSDLGPCRKSVTDVLLTLGALPVVQEHFAPDYRTVSEMLRARIDECDAVICLVGRRYGQEARERPTDRPRRSYTQLEYEIAVELGKPVFLFLAADDCELDPAPDEPEELLGLQLEHVKRIAGSDRLYFLFHSIADVTDQVRVMRLDPRSLAQGVTRHILVVLRAELLDGNRSRQPDEAWVRTAVLPFQSVLRSTLKRQGGELRSESPGEYEVNFQTADSAVTAALELQQAMHGPDWTQQSPGLRIGIHVGQIVQFTGVDESHELQISRGLDVCRALTRAADASQTLLSRMAFDLARESIARAPSGDGEAASAVLSWRSHGRYLLAGSDEPEEICEVGVPGQAPLAAPADSPMARRADSLEQIKMQGWRPAPGQEIPRRPGWIIERKLGEGGFGEVWLARHGKTRQLRVFKFCFDATRLTSFKRELTLFRLLQEALGDRADIARLLEVELDDAPFFLESEFVEGGNLRDWCDSNGRLSSLSLDERLRLVAETAVAVAAAHSVGIIHKDLKPSNVFMRQAANGRWHPMLADFGIGAIADRSQLEKRGITAAGFSQTLAEPGSSRTGTRMYQPPEANLVRTATVQGDVYALGVLLFQMLVADFDQPLGHGWERRLEETRSRALASCPDGADGSRAKTRSHALDATGEFVYRLLRDDVSDCVEGDPDVRLGSAAQLVERLQSFESRLADRLARIRADRSAARLRRLRAALAASLGSLVVLGSLCAFAITQWRRANSLNDQAEQSRAAATRNSELAFNTLSDVILQLQTSFRDLPGSSAIRHRLLDKAITQLEVLSRQLDLQAAADRHTASAIQSLGDWVRQFGEGSADALSRVGDPSAAEASVRATESARLFYSRSTKIFEALAKADPSNAEAKRDLSSSYVRLGDVQLELGSTNNALESYQKFLELSEALVQADPNDTEAKRDLSISYDRFGDAQLRLGATKNAFEHYEKSLKLREKLATADPIDDQAKRELSLSYNNLGKTQMRLGAANTAIEYYQKCLDLRYALVKSDPNDAQAKRDLSVAHEKLGDVLFQLGATSEALEHYQESWELRETLATTDATNVWVQRELSSSLHIVAETHKRANNLARARECEEKALAVDTRISERLPERADTRRDLASDCECLARICGQANDWPAALTYAKQSFVHARAAREIAGATEPFQWDFSNTLALLGAAQAGAGQSKEARESLEEAVRAAPKSAIVRNALAWFLATCRDDSVRDGTRAVQVATKLCGLTEGNDPSNFDTLAVAHAEAGQFDQAIRWIKKALENPQAISPSDLEAFKVRLKLYESHKPYHEVRPPAIRSLPPSG